MNDAVSLRPVSAEDAQQLADLRVDALRESLERVGRFDAQRARMRLLATFAPEHTREIVVDGRRVGFVVVKPQDGGLLLDHLYISPAWQGRGAGAAVLRAVFADADARGLDVRVGALRGSDANRFYQRHGFQLIEQAEFDNYYVRRPRPAPGGRR